MALTDLHNSHTAYMLKYSYPLPKHSAMTDCVYVEFTVSYLHDVSGQLHALAALPPGKLPAENSGWISVVISLICDNSVATHNLAFLSYWYRNKRLQMQVLTRHV